MKSLDFQYMCDSSSFEWRDDELPNHLFVQGDIKNGSWFHLLGVYAIGLMMMSPPCPPWSLATSALGLMKEKGRLTLEGTGLCQTEGHPDGKCCSDSKKS